MPWLLDGNNLAGGQDRETVRRAAMAVARQERVRITVFFDGAPPPGSGNVQRFGSVELRYAPNADAAIVSYLANDGRGWLVATDDRGLAMRVKAVGARVVGAADFWRKAERAAAADTGRDSVSADLKAEMTYFRDPAHRLDPHAAPVHRRRKRRS